MARPAARLRDRSHDLLVDLGVALDAHFAEACTRRIERVFPLILLFIAFLLIRLLLDQHVEF